MRRILAALTGLVALAGLLAGCADAAAGNSVTIVVGYQSKTINTVTAGTLLRSLGYFEQQLAQLGKTTGKKYSVTWQDYDTGAPITAQMIAGKIDIGSMGDYPMLINGSRSQNLTDNKTEMVSVTGYNLRGALNMIVVPPGSTATTVRDLVGEKVSTSVGSAADGTLVHALRNANLDPANSVQILNQQPQVGASALQAGSAAALAQFVAWPGDLVFQKQAKVLYDGAELNVPTLHGVVVRDSFAAAQPQVLAAFLRAQLQATQYLQQHPLAAAESVAAATGLPAEVVYLYNGPNGLVTFDPTIKPVLRSALSGDVPFLKSIGVLNTLDVNQFVNDSALRAIIGAAYDQQAASTANPARITGTDTVCGRPVSDPATAGEVWLAGEQATHPAADPTCLLRFVRQAQAAGKQVRAAYVPDATTGTRWFADHDSWVDDPATSRLLPFTTEAEARDYVAGHPGTRIVSYADALTLAG